MLFHHVNQAVENDLVTGWAEVEAYRSVCQQACTGKVSITLTIMQ